MTLLRRLLIVAAFAFWQGGFTFYAAIVVPIGTDVLGSSAEQARITRLVAWHINLAGAAALAGFALDILVEPRLRRSRWIALLLMAAILAGQWVLRDYLDRMFHGEEAYLDSRAAFRPWHRAYLWLSTVQFALGVMWLFLTLRAWRTADTLRNPPLTPAITPAKTSVS